MNLHDTTDATIWADEWLKTITDHPGIPTEKGTMVTWFACAIEAGYDAGRKAGEAVQFSGEKLHGGG